MKTNKKNNFLKTNIFLIFLVIVFIWSIFHIWFLETNEILKNADNFAYLQMSHHFGNFSLEWFWTWWFGFLYSLFIAIFDKILFFVNEYNSALFLNIVLFWIWSVFLYKISRFYLARKYAFVVLILYYFTPILLNFNISILSENIYIPTILWLFYFLLKLEVNWELKKIKIWNIFIISLLLALLYFTRSEAFIYIWSVILIFFFIHWKKIFTKKRFLRFLKNSALLCVFFGIIISPYIFYLHSITWEWWLTNKWSSNLRQAELRWTEKMDDDWFEQAVWELTDDNHYLKAWFAWWLDYHKWEEIWWIVNYFLDNPGSVISRFFSNQKKLYLENLPEIISWNAITLFDSEDSFFHKNYVLYLIFLIPVFLVLYWFYALFRKKEYWFLLVFFSFYIIGSTFFTIFFVLNRYFIIFLPLFLIIMIYWIKEIKEFRYMKKLIKLWLISLIIAIYLLWDYSFYNSVKNEDWNYEIKKIAWERLKTEIISQNWNNLENTKIMERFPIVTYYAWTKKRFITPFTDNLENLLEYANFNKIEYFVVDDLDFATYRPKLKFLLDENFEHENLQKLMEFYDSESSKKIILYKFDF